MNTAITSSPEAIVPAPILELAREACYQIEGMVEALHSSTSSIDTLPYIVRCMAVRLDTLNNVLLAALDVESEGGLVSAELAMRAMLLGRFKEVVNG